MRHWRTTTVATLLIVGLVLGPLALAWLTLPPQRGGLELSKGLVVFQADRHDGKDEAWIRRPSAGKPSWGIHGTGYPDSGSMWFDKFPGKTGRYKIELGAVLERDGAPAYRVLAGGAILGEGEYPYACGTLMCEATREACPDRAVYIDLGEHLIRGEVRIQVWGRSDYPCSPEHGSYARWYELRFTKAGKD